MESPFDRLGKDRESQKKPKGKKMWVLSRQYLQPLDEPEDVVESEPISDLSVRNKLRCICRSAFYGMKEGLLTGVFLGGFYGVLKLLNGNSSIFFGSTENTENSNEMEKLPRHYYGGGVPQERKNPGRTRRMDTRTYLLSGRRQSGSRSNSISYQEKLSSYRTIEETLYGLSREKKSQNSYATKRARNIDLNCSKLPVRTDKHLGSISSKVNDKKKYDGRTSEKIEIVGYAFVQTMGAFEAESTTSKSMAHGSPKQSKSELEKKDKEEEEEEQEPDPQKNKACVECSATVLSRLASESIKSPEKSALTVSEMSSKSLKSKESGRTEKREKSAKSLKSKESVLIAKHERSAKSLKIGESLLTARREKSTSSVRSGSASIADDSVPPTTTGNEKEHRESITKGLHKALSSLKGVTSKNRSKQSIISEVDEERQKPSRITIISPKHNSHDSSRVQNAEQSSSVLIKSLEPDQSEISARPTTELSQDSRLRSRDSNKTSRAVSKHSVRSSIIMESDPSTPDSSRRPSKATLKSSERYKRRISENLYPSGHPPSYLVNAEDVSNGYSSPVTVVSQEQQSEHDTIRSKYSESSFTADINTSRVEFDDVGITGSNISEFQIRSPFRAFSPSVSATQTSQSRTLKSSAWSFSTFQNSSTIQPEESESAIPQLKDESYLTLKTDKQTGPVIFSESEGSAPQKDRSSLGEGPRAQQSEKLLVSSEQIPEKSDVADTFNKSLPSSEQVFDNSQAANEYPSEKSLFSSERLTDRSLVDDQYSERFNMRIQEPSTKSFTGVLAKSNSSIIQDVSSGTSRSSVAKGASAASQTQKASPEKEELTEFGVFSSVSDNTIVLCACNCAIILGILCTVISTTRASLKI